MNAAAMISRDRSRVRSPGLIELAKMNPSGTVGRGFISLSRLLLQEFSYFIPLMRDGINEAINEKLFCRALGRSSANKLT